MTETEVNYIQKYTACTEMYSKAWVDDYLLGAAFNLCRNDEGNHLPWCARLLVFGKKDETYFDNSYWKLEVFIFRNNEDMRRWARRYGQNIYGVSTLCHIEYLKDNSVE